MDKKNTEQEVEIENIGTTEQKIEIADESVQKILVLEEQVQELKNQILLSLADSENVRKRAIKEVADAQKYAVGKFAESLTSVLDNLYRSTEHLNDELLKNEVVRKIYEGIDITRKEFLTVLEKHGVKRIFPQIGDKFDHNFHQALSQQSSADYPNESILNVVQAGYLLNDRLLKPAMVVVSQQ
jgi:molecular chaperone GrpE